ncbi:TadE/TadG family type IV pilus assembly protein [Bacillus taeanensis]|uniref:Putative Flp pilus-assembly TadG-like N-terminal domain-containing protein n=1 Tax=Bacillus taeanensis TaxID=273032 RepID=A0A366XZ69_9BACI|nr:Tad domain-containing protein [Bacillus taeanensis]RBW70896.1 hypothetical protein DS031_02535 [Bacillus taeanensis]
MKLVKQILKDHKGQAVVLFVLMIPVLWGGIGLAVDLGYVMVQKQKLQDSADFAVLSGAQKLPDASAAISIAAHVFNNNYGEAIPVENIIIDVNSLTIKLHHTDKVSLFFMPLLGVNEVSISAEAKAKSAVIYKPSALIPLSIPHTLPVVKGIEVTLWGQDKKILVILGLSTRLLMEKCKIKI